MESFLETLNKIEQEYISKRKYLTSLKRGAILLGVFMVILGGLQVLKSKERFEMSNIQVEITVLLIAALVMIPILAVPLHKLIASKRIRELKWKIKSSIFNSGLEKHTTEYNFSFNRSFPEKDLKNLDLIANQFSFFKGNDLIVGKIKGYKFGISDIHAFSLRKRKFDGLIGVIYFNEPEIAKDFYNRIIKNLPKGGEARIFEKKVYFLQHGDLEHFEIEFNKHGINKEKLILDFKYFESFVNVFFGEV